MTTTLDEQSSSGVNNVKMPVAYVVFNRPRHTIESLNAIRAIRPEKLMIIADGPRPGHPTDSHRCAEVRAIVEKIDWPCEVVRNFSDVNLGCKKRIVTGLDWVFSLVDRAIVIEDDCLPHPDFFGYCEALLKRYEDDERVMAITGINLQDGRVRGDGSYYFSKYNHVWGWASWSRAWQKNDPELTFWPEWKRSSDWKRHCPDTIERTYWSDIFDRMRRNEIDTWDYPWTASVWYHGGLTATPNVNLVTNIGFGPDGTHTVTAEDQPGTPTRPLGTLVHPTRIVRDHRADRYVFDHSFGGLNKRPTYHALQWARNFVPRVARKLRKLLTLRARPS